jgi:phosphate starvation-inducible PhoH-like protein
MKLSVRINRGIESLFGTRDENIRLLEQSLGITTRLREDAIEIEGEDTGVLRAESILNDYVALVKEGQVFTNGDLHSYLRVVTGDSQLSLRGLVESGRQRNFGKKAVTPKTLNQRMYLDAIERYDLVLGIGPAGTGKTYLAVAMAVSALLSKRVSRIVLTRPAVEAGEKLGFLPGTLQEKIDPYLRPLYDALYEMLDAEKVEKFLERNVIEVAPIAFMRGRTLNDSFIILDEAQNSTPEQMKMVLTRQGFNSKMVVTGDITQIDLPAGRGSGLLNAMDVLRGIDEIKFVTFDEKDVVRHSLVQKIIRAYDRYQEASGLNRQMTLRWSEPVDRGPETNGAAAAKVDLPPEVEGKPEAPKSDP